jgi:hypothetical protein
MASQDHLQHAGMDSEDTLMGSRADREVRTHNPGLIIQALVAEPVLGRPSRYRGATVGCIGCRARTRGPSTGHSGVRPDAYADCSQDHGVVTRASIEIAGIKAPRCLWPTARPGL